jgi:hypothetical protein
VKRLIEKLEITECLTMLPPDLPFFIKSEESFEAEWRSFLATPSPNYKFYLNPSPKSLGDIKLERHFLPYVKQSMCRSRSFMESAFSLMQFNEGSFNFEHNSLLTGMVSSTVENVYFCDYPFLKERQMIAMDSSLEDMRQLIKSYAYFKQIKK